MPIPGSDRARKFQTETARLEKISLMKRPGLRKFQSKTARPQIISDKNGPASKNFRPARAEKHSQGFKTLLPN